MASDGTFGSLVTPGHRRIVDLANETHRNAMSRDLHNAEIVGQVSNWDFPSSSYQCEFRSARLTEVRFPGKDFRDCTFRETQFIRSKFKKASIIGCVFIDCRFIESTIDDYSIHDCIISGTDFLESQILGSMVRYSRAQGCKFVNCILENKVFDECLLFDLEFLDTNIDFHVLIDNFGLRSIELPASAIRVDRSLQLGKEEMFNFDGESLSDLYQGLATIERFRLQAYLVGDTLFDGPIVDELFSAENWQQSITTPSAFIRLIENLTEFVCREFEQGRCYLFLVARLHSVMFELYQNLSDTRYAKISQSVIGCHLRLGQVLNLWEGFIISKLGKKPKKLQFYTEDNLDESYINNTMQELSAITGGLKYSVGRRNSPVFVEILEHIDKIFLIAAIFTITRFSFEIERGSMEELSTDKKVPTTRKVLELTAGGGNVSLTASPWGDLIVRASIALNSTLITKLRRILHVVVSDNDEQHH